VDEGQTSEDAAQLRAVVAALEEEVSILRRRLREAPGRADELEAELNRTRDRLDRAVAQNDKLSAVLEEAREQLGVLREEVEKLTSPPNNFGTVLEINDDGTLDILTGSRKLRVAAQPSVEVKKLKIGQEVILNEAFNIIDIRHFEAAGDILRVRETMDDGRVVVIAHADEEKVLKRSDSMADVFLRAGDYVRIDTKTNLILEKLERPEIEELVLEEVPTSRTGMSAVWQIRSNRFATPSSCHTSTGTFSRSTSWSHLKGSCFTALQVVARPSSPKPWRTALPRRSPSAPAIPTFALTSSISRARSC